MNFLSKRTKVLGLLTIAFFLLFEYLGWKSGCTRRWLPVIYAAQDVVSGNFQLDPCDMWGTLTLLDRIAALGPFTSAIGFFGSLALDMVAWIKTRKFN